MTMRYFFSIAKKNCNRQEMYLWRPVTYGVVDREFQG